MIDIVEILLHWHAGRPKAEVARSLGRTGTQSASTRPRPRRPASSRRSARSSREEWAALVRDWFPELVDAASPQPHPPADRAPPRRRSRRCSKTNTATTVHQRLRDEQGLGVGLSSFRRYVWREFPEESWRGHGDAAAARGRPRRGGPDRLRLPRPVVRPDARAALAAGLGLRHGARLQPPHVRAPGAVAWTSAPGRRATSRPSSSSAACPAPPGAATT